MKMEDGKASDEHAIRELIDGFAKAFRAKDIDGVMSVFSPAIVSFDIVPPLQAIGSEALAQHWRQTFEAYQGPIHVEFPEVRVTAGNDVAFSYCLHRVKGTLKSGEQTDRWLRWTACYRRIEGRWLIVHEQVSVPVELRTGKAMLDLKP